MGMLLPNSLPYLSKTRAGASLVRFPVVRRNKIWAPHVPFNRTESYPVGEAVVANGNGNGKKKKKRWIIISIVSVAVLALVIVAVAATRGGAKIDPTKLAKVEKGDLAKSVVATGKVTPITKVEIKSKASGIVKKLY